MRTIHTESRFKRSRFAMVVATLVLAVSGAATQIASAGNARLQRVALNDATQGIDPASPVTDADDTPVFGALSY